MSFAHWRERDILILSLRKSYKWRVLRSDEIRSLLMERQSWARVRHIYDKETWVVLLAPIVKSDSAIQDNLLAVTSFRCRRGHKQRVGLILRPLCILRPPYLEHKYVVIQYSTECDLTICDIFDEIMSKRLDA